MSNDIRELYGLMMDDVQRGDPILTWAIGAITLLVSALAALLAAAVVTRPVAVALVLSVFTVPYLVGKTLWWFHERR